MVNYVLRNGVALLKMSNGPINALGYNLRCDILRSIDKAIKDRAVAIVLYGGGRNFSAGADITEFARKKHLQTPSLNEVIQVFDELDIPTIAGIHGFALGGGLELALACHYRLADNTARVGLPEVHLGILPGAGGTQRLPRLVGVPTALDLMTSGRHVSAQDALSYGIVDRLLNSSLRGDEITASDAPAPALAELIEYACSPQVQDTDISKVTTSLREVPPLLTEGGVDEFFKAYHQEHFMSSGGNEATPGMFRGLKAPANIFKCVQVAAKVPSFSTGMTYEARSFEELAAGSQAQALQYVFFCEKKHKKHVQKVSNETQEYFSRCGADANLPTVEISMLRAAQDEIDYLVNNVGVPRAEVEKALWEQVNWVPPTSAHMDGRDSDCSSDEQVWSSTDLTTRVMFPMLNAGFNAIDAQYDHDGAVNNEEIDMSFLHAPEGVLSSTDGMYAKNFPRKFGGPLFWAERVIGLRDVNMRLKELYELFPEHDAYKPAELLVTIVQGQSTIGEELYMRKNPQ